MNDDMLSLCSYTVVYYDTKINISVIMFLPSFVDQHTWNPGAAEDHNGCHSTPLRPEQGPVLQSSFSEKPELVKPAMRENLGFLFHKASST